jgi:hypothetical protein
VSRLKWVPPPEEQAQMRTILRRTRYGYLLGVSA